LLLNRYAGYQVTTLLLALGGCSSLPPSPPLSDCQKVASYAGTIAAVRDIGVPPETLQQRAADRHITFPVEGILQEVYERRDQKPKEIEELFLTVCHERGYNRLRITLRELKVERFLQTRDVGATR
jgi:hypothetical protein